VEDLEPREEEEGGELFAPFPSMMMMMMMMMIVCVGCRELSQ
jgi:hypothetical protein